MKEATIDSLASVQFSLGRATETILQTLATWQKENNVQRLWASDATLWTNTDENKWTGWLNIGDEDKEISKIAALAKKLHTEGYEDAVVLGMGGSSLCPAMLAETFGKIDGYPRLHVLDSTDPQQIKHLEKQLNLKKCCFIVSSKSGTTLEPNIFKDYFYSRLSQVFSQKEVGKYFFAVTDPGTKLDTLAQEECFREVFHGVPSVGGRYSALTNFGMLPGGLMGIDIVAFLNHAKTMQQACKHTIVKENPGVVLGVILGVLARLGKDKVTLIASPGIHALGAWLEQLLAESTGKQGRGLIPVDQEPLGKPEVYGDDRIFVYIRLENAPDRKQDLAVDALEKANCSVVRLHLQDKMHLGAELFRWEVATAVAGSVIGINPFNQPDVEESKVLALKMTSDYEKKIPLDEPPTLFTEKAITLATDHKNAQAIKEKLQGNASLASYLRAFLSQVKKSDYVDLSAFIEMSAQHTEILQKIRTLIRDQKKVATCLGFGPRFLHSTGQAYKGGPNTGVFLQITSEDAEDIQVPGRGFTFGLVIKAQALSDFDVLAKRSRRILRIHLGKHIQDDLEKLHEAIKQALS